jgi:polyisoprenoid-binding protein YceI
MRRAGLLSMLLLLALPALAQSTSFKADPTQSKVAFRVGGTLHETHGTFSLKSGDVTFGPGQISGLIVVSAGSGTSGNDTRDRRMTSSILDAPHFAEATFRPEHLTGEIASTGSSTVQVTGVLTLHGTPHDLTVPLEVHIDSKTCTAKTQFMIPYIQWGLKDPSTFLLKVDKEVTMEITLVGQISTSTQR